MVDFNFKSEEEVKEYLDNLGTEYRFSCLHEKNPEGCHLLGDYLEAIKKDFRKAAKIYASNCDDFKYDKSCFKYGTYCFLGKGLDNIDYVKALHYYKKGCDMNNPDACLHSGLMLTSGGEDRQKLIKRDYKEGVKYLSKGCSLKSERSCYFASGIYISGAEGVERDMTKAFEFALKACDMGNLYACSNLSQMYKKGDGVEKNEKLYVEYKKRALEINRQMKKGQGIEFQQHT